MIERILSRTSAINQSMEKSAEVSAIKENCNVSHYLSHQGLTPLSSSIALWKAPALLSSLGDNKVPKVVSFFFVHGGEHKDCWYVFPRYNVFSV